MIVYQNDHLACVPCSIAWAVNDLEPDQEPKDWKDLYTTLQKKEGGTNPQEALTKAQAMGWISSWKKIWNFQWNIEHELKKKDQRVLLGLPMHKLIWAGSNKDRVIEWDGVNTEDHMIVAKDKNNDGTWNIVSWGKEDEQDYKTLEKNYPIQVVYVLKTR